MVDMQKLTEVCRPTQLLELLEVEKVLQAYFQGEIWEIFTIIM